MVAILPAHRRDEIIHAVRAMYTTVAEAPRMEFHFPVGRSAAVRLGYPEHLLGRAPDPAVEAFAGVACPFLADVIRRKDTILDIGSGSGTDALIAASIAGREGRVFALDLTSAMLRRLARTAAACRFANVHALLGDAERIPLADACVDVVTSNGAINLVLDKPVAFSEIFRVLRPGGWFQLADVVLGAPVTDSCRADPRLWVECIVGATLEPRLLRLIGDAGFRDVEVLERRDYFAESPSPSTREIAAALRAGAMVLRARRPLA